MNKQQVTETRLKVRTYECDSFGHVNNAVYLNYLECGRMDVLEAGGYTLAALKDQDVLIVVRRIEIDYKASLKEGETLVVRTFLKAHTRMKGVFGQEILRGSDGAVAVKADVTWVFVDLEGRLIPIPAFFKKALGF